MRPEKVRAFGPWVLVKVDPPKEKTESGLYLPAGNLEERLGHATGVVLSVGAGAQRKDGTRIPNGVKEGDRVLFRGYLQEANRPTGRLDREHSLIKIDDIVGVLDESGIQV